MILDFSLKIDLLMRSKNWGYCIWRL